MFYLILVLAYYNVNCNAQVASWNWTHPVEKTIVNENGETVTVNHIKFKRCRFTYVGASSLAYTVDTTRLKCGTSCMEHPECLAWSFFVLLNECYLYDYKFDSNPVKTSLVSQSSSDIDCYEVEVIIYY